MKKQWDRFTTKELECLKLALDVMEFESLRHSTGDDLFNEISKELEKRENE